MIERVHLRLLAWADQVVGGIGLGRGSSVLGRLADSGQRSDYGTVLLIDADSDEVEGAVEKLSDDYREVIKVFYLEGDLAAISKAKKLKMSAATMYRRRDAAHVLLDSELYGVDLPKVC